MRKHLSEPWFSLVYVGAKRFEGRLGNNADFKDAAVGSTVTWFNDDLGASREVVSRIVSKSTHASFRHMLKAKGVGNVLPTVKTLDHGEEVYGRFYGKANQNEHGVLCIELSTRGPPNRRHATQSAGPNAGRKPHD